MARDSAVNRSFRASTPADAGQLRALFTEAFASHDASGDLGPDFMQWKYWERRDDWAEPRSYLLEEDGRAIAHLAVWPVILPGVDRPIRGMQMMDWAAAKGARGAGGALLRELTDRFDFIYIVGGSPSTHRVVARYGFVEIGRAWHATRPLRPGHAFTRRSTDWKVALKAARDTIWLMRHPARPADSGWTATAVEPGELPSARVPADSPFSPRSPAFFEYLARCPVARFRFYLVTDRHVPKGYFALALVHGRAKLGGVWLLDACAEHWHLAFTLALDVASQWPDAVQLELRGSGELVAGAAVRAGLRLADTEPVYVLGREDCATLLKRLQCQLVDSDGMFLPGPSLSTGAVLRAAARAISRAR